MSVLVCALDGVEMGSTRSGALIHLDEIPREVPEHFIEEVIESSEYQRRSDSRVNLKGAVEDLLAHHATLHPLSECAWAARIRTALRLA